MKADEMKPTVLDEVVGIAPTRKESNMRRTVGIWTLSALSLALAACTGSRGISENPQAGVTRNSCTGSSCLRFEFTVDPVANLNYRCGTVVDVTTSIGTGQCPSGSVATFYLRSENGQREVVLGSTRIDPARGLSAAEAGDSPLVRITPANLNISSSMAGTAAASTAVINITRLLHALRDQDSQGQVVEPYVNEAPINRIVINENLKRGIDKLEKDISASDFEDTTNLEQKLAPWLDARSSDSTYPALALISADEARTRLQRTLNTIQAGSYYGTPALSLFGINSSGIPGLSTDLLNLGIQSNNTGTGQYTVMQIHVATDRDNRSMGQGMQWTTNTNNPQVASSLYQQVPFQQLQLKNDQASFDPLTKLIRAYHWLLLSATDDQPTAEVRFETGKLLRDTVVAGSETTYRLYTGLNSNQEVPKAELGTWAQYALDANGNASATTATMRGTDTLYKTSNADTFFDRNVWRVAAAVPAGQKYVFPLSLKLTLSYGSGCSANNTSACKENLSADPIGITILANGNIVSDRNHDCNGTLNASLVDGAAAQEYRVGYVRAAYLSPDKSSAYISPTLLIGSKDIYGAAYNGVQMSTQSPTPRLKMDVAGLLNSNNGKGSVVFSDASTSDSTQTGSTPASWYNIYNLMIQQRAGVTALTADETARARQATGLVTAEIADCYSVMTK